ncbi:caspase domain-containing protein [Paraphaeosphaeria sporulosa]
MMHWAILVGVLYYGSSLPDDNRLKGCVADVEDMEEFLELLKLPVKIFKSTSNYPTVGAGHPPEKPKERAILRNFIDRLNDVIEYGAPTFGVCFSSNVEPVEHLDEEFGATGTRTDLHPTCATFRNAQVIPQWITNPQGYTIFCACASSQIANEVYELKPRKEADTETGLQGVLNREHFTTAKRPIERGALSHVLLEALKQLRQTDTTIIASSLFEHQRAQFHVRVPNQTPVLYGSKTTSFFADSLSFSDTEIVPVFNKDRKLMMHKGPVHGVVIGDKYSLFPLRKSADASDKYNLYVGCIVDVPPE